MKISLNNGKTYKNAKSNIKIIYEGLHASDYDKEMEAELHITLTETGAIVEVWNKETTLQEPLMGIFLDNAQDIVDKLVGKKIGGIYSDIVQNVEPVV